MSHATLVGALRCGCAYCGGEMAARALCKGLRALYDGALAKLEAAHA